MKELVDVFCDTIPLGVAVSGVCCAVEADAPVAEVITFVRISDRNIIFISNNKVSFSAVIAKGTKTLLLVDTNIKLKGVTRRVGSISAEECKDLHDVYRRACPVDWEKLSILGESDFICLNLTEISVSGIKGDSAGTLSYTF